MHPAADPHRAVVLALTLTLALALALVVALVVLALALTLALALALVVLALDGAHPFEPGILVRPFGAAATSATRRCTGCSRAQPRPPPGNHAGKRGGSLPAAVPVTQEPGPPEPRHGIAHRMARLCVLLAGGRPGAGEAQSTATPRSVGASS
ncbi:hypothetical protein ABZ611_04260 [Streptomyces sp. NPDC007861]|uniref:hypothetical protein n=1 Tax=Streptomyces sp. NPDC007861 TaxID=3154893 RepID=UPI0033C8C9DD